MPAPATGPGHEYAAEQAELGVHYYRLSTGDREANLSRAIECYSEALRFYNAADTPADYARVQHNMGAAYAQLPGGDRAANLARAVECYAEALRFYTADAAPLDYAMTQNALGVAYSDLPSADSAANLARAVECYAEALRFYTPDAAPLQYAMTQYNLGATYADLRSGNRAANLARAVECYTEALRFYTAEAAPDDYAATQSGLGSVYAQLPTGDQAANVARAVECYTEALRFYTPDGAPLDYARIQYNLGAAYAGLRSGDRAANLARAVECYTEALRFYTDDAAPGEYAATQTNLGIALAGLPTGDRAANLARAVECYTEALRFYTADAAPFDYAEVQVNLGVTYSEIPGGDRAANLARAVECYTEALRFFSPQGAPFHYAAAQTNLGAAYGQLPTGDRAANLDRAIGCYTEALRFFTPQTAPAQYATTQANRGVAYAELPAGDRDANLELAIGSYTEALRIYTAEAAPAEYSMTQTNLGNAYAQLRAGDRAANMTRAIECYREALRFRTAETAPLDYAMTQTNLGAAYSFLRADDPANVSRAIECYTEALRFRTAEMVPFGYASTQYNLGAAYVHLQTGDRAANRNRAIGCFTEALRFYTAEAAPDDCRRAARSLGDIHFEQGRWAEAHSAYSTAIRAGELLYQETGSETGRRAELEAAGNAVTADAYCLARLGRITEAVQRLETGRARALGEALALDRAALQEARPADRAALSAAASHIKALQTEGRREFSAESPAAPQARSFAEQSADLVQARENLAEIIRRIRGYLPGFAGEGLDYPGIAAASSPACPLVYLLTVSCGSLALLIPAGTQSAVPEQAIWLDRFTALSLDALLVERDSSGEITGGYLVGQVTGDLDQLMPALAENLEILRRELLGPLSERLTDLGTDSATVIPVGRLSLLPLPAAAPDDCTIALAPSARALRTARHAHREHDRSTAVLLAVGDPLPLPAGWNSLAYAGVEIRAIQQFFRTGARRILPRDASTRQAIAGNLRGATHLHLACHGGFDVGEPLDSALYLSGGDRLTLRDLLSGDLDLSSQRLAVLSACQTAVVEFERVPDEAIGLPAGFLQAGVPGVVATLWPVNDRSTAVLIGEFYRLLLVHERNPAAALAAARTYLRDATALDLAEWFELRYADSGGTDLTAYEAAADFRATDDPASRPYASPVYWAGFVYYGS